MSRDSPVVQFSHWDSVFFVWMVLLAHAALMAWSASRHSPSVDEVGHMAAGLNHWHTGNFDLYRVNPPLGRLVATLPLAVAGIREPDEKVDSRPPRRPEFFLGKEFVSVHGPRAFWYFTVARWACLPFTLLGGYVCYRWARELYGPRSGLLAAVLWSFCPLVLANAQMITPDTAGAALGTLACYLFWRWLRQPNRPRAYWAGLGLGLALLCKTSWIFLFLLWPLSWAGLRLSQRPTPSRREWLAQGGQIGLSLFLCVTVVNMGYLFEGCFVRLGDYPFVSKALTVASDTGPPRNRFAGTWLGSVPVPLPANFVSGIDVQKADFERGLWSYLRGQWRQGGWWYYYLYGLSVKWPLGNWLLLVLAIVSCVLGRTRLGNWRDELFLVLPGIALFVLVSSQTGFNHHLRYILPSLPFAFIWMSRVAEVSVSRSRLWIAVTAMAVFWSVGSSLKVYPHSLSYFNELAGGPENGSAHLVDSNLDWGQDLLYLKHWLDEHPESRPLGLAYFGYIDPRVAGIEFVLPPSGPTEATDLSLVEEGSLGPRPGWFAVSATLLRGYSYSVANGKGGSETAERGTYTYFLHFRPVATAGYSIFIYHLDREDCNRVRAELELRPLP